MSGHGEFDERQPGDLNGFSAARYPIAAIKLLRNLYGIGLKEAKDIHDGVRALTDPGLPAATQVWRSLVVVNPANVANPEEVERLKREVKELTQSLEAEQNRFGHCRECDAYLENGEPLYCSTYCYENARKRYDDNKRIAEIDAQIEGLKRDIADLQGERDFLFTRNHPEGNEDAINLNDDYEPF